MTRPSRHLAAHLRAGLLLGALLGAVLASTARAAESSRDDKTLSPYFWVKPAGRLPSAGESGAPGPAAAEALPLKSTRVDATLSGVVADVRVTQVYANTGTVPIEAVYIFPGSTRAAVHGLTIIVGERRLEAKIKKRDEARQTYEAAKTEGKTATLLEQQRPNVFQMNLANIQPGDVIQVELRYTELLVPVDGVYEFVYPTVAGPRYSDRPAKGGNASDGWVENPYLKKGDAAPSTFDLVLTLAAGLPIEDAVCRTHSAHIAYTNAREARLTLDPAEMSGGNRDFILRYRLAGGAIQSGLLLAEGGENFFLLMVQPPARPSPTEIPPRDFVFVVDVSGSMNGFPLNTAKQLIKDLLQTLRVQDTFNLLLFAGDSEVLAAASVPATPENIRSAVKLLERQNGGGATQLLPALKKAYALPQAENVSRTIAVVTDGYIDIEAEAFQLTRAQLGRANLFAFGIGSAVNRHLIEGLARAGRGEPFIVTAIEEATPAASRFREYISNPVLTRVAVAFEGVETYDVEPAALPDVFALRPVVIAGKWRGPRSGKIRVTGLTGNQPYQATLDLADATVLPSADGLSRLWARTKIAELSDAIAVERSDERVAQVTSLGLTYNLLTRYTSFVAVDEVVRRVEPNLQTIKQPLPLPQGVENSAIGNPIPTSPEPETLGLVLVAAGVAAFLLARHRGRSSAK